MQVFVDIRSESTFGHILYRIIFISLIFFQQRCTRKTNEHYLFTHNCPHGFMQTSTLGTVTLINKNKYIVAFYTKVITIFLGNDALQFIKIFIETNFCARLIFLCVIIGGMGTKLVNQ